MIEFESVPSVTVTLSHESLDSRPNRLNRLTGIFIGELVDELNLQLKKSGRQHADTRMLDIEFNDQTPVERVAISSKQHGKFWKHESCRASGKTGPPKHKYICEL